MFLAVFCLADLCFAISFPVHVPLLHKMTAFQFGTNVLIRPVLGTTINILQTDYERTYVQVEPYWLRVKWVNEVAGLAGANRPYPTALLSMEGENENIWIHCYLFGWFKNLFVLCSHAKLKYTHYFTFCGLQGSPLLRIWSFLLEPYKISTYRHAHWLLIFQRRKGFPSLISLINLVTLNYVRIGDVCSQLFAIATYCYYCMFLKIRQPHSPYQLYCPDQVKKNDKTVMTYDLSAWFRDQYPLWYVHE